MELKLFKKLCSINTYITAHDFIQIDNSFKKLK